MKQRVELIEHIMRYENLIKTIIEGYIDGNRRRIRPRAQYTKQFTGDVSCNFYEEMKLNAQRGSV